MLDQIVFEETCRGIKVSAYTDRYAYDPEDDSLLFISLAGADQAVKAISSAVIGGKTVSIRRQKNAEVLVSSHPASRFRVLSTKLPSGAVHQLVADTRFFGNDNAIDRIVVIPQDENVSKVVYGQVLAHLASPLLPQWAPWICGQLKELDHLRKMAGTLRVVRVSADEATVDEIVSKGVRTGCISFSVQGDRHVGIH
jgi:hypothetical protein